MLAKELKIKYNNKKEDFFGASLLGNLLADKKAIGMSQGRGMIRAGKGTVRTGQDF